MRSSVSRCARKRADWSCAWRDEPRARSASPAINNIWPRIPLAALRMTRCVIPDADADRPRPRCRPVPVLAPHRARERAGAVAQLEPHLGAPRLEAEHLAE